MTSFCMFKKNKVYCEEEEEVAFLSEEKEALFLGSVVKPGSKLANVFPDKNRLQKMVLRRAIHDPNRRTEARRFRFEPKMTRFGLEAQGVVLIPPPPLLIPTPIPVPLRSRRHSVFRPELPFLCMLVIYWRLIAHTLHLLNPKST